MTRLAPPKRVNLYEAALERSRPGRGDAAPFSAARGAPRVGSHESSDRHNIRTGKELIEERQDRPRWQTRPGPLRAHRGVLTRGSCQQPPSRLRMANVSRCERLRRTPADRRSGLGSRSPSWVSTSITTMAASSRNECPHPAFAAIRTRNVSRLAADSRCECTYRESAARGWTRSPPPIPPTWENA